MGAACKTHLSRTTWLCGECILSQVCRRTDPCVVGSGVALFASFFQCCGTWEETSVGEEGRAREQERTVRRLRLSTQGTTSLRSSSVRKPNVSSMS